MSSLDLHYACTCFLAIKVSWHKSYSKQIFSTHQTLTKMAKDLTDKNLVLYIVFFLSCHNLSDHNIFAKSWGCIYIIIWLKQLSIPWMIVFCAKSMKMLMIYINGRRFGPVAFISTRFTKRKIPNYIIQPQS